MRVIIFSLHYLSVELVTFKRVENKKFSKISILRIIYQNYHQKLILNVYLYASSNEKENFKLKNKQIELKLS